MVTVPLLLFNPHCRFETTKEFVTEKNKEDIKNGSILKFCQSPRKIVHELLHKLTSNTDPQNRLICLRALESQSADYAVAQELVRSSGLEILIKTVSEGSASAQVVSLVILTFHEVMKQEDLLSWEDDIISPEFIGQVAANIDTEKTMLALKQDEKTHQCCLAVLEALVNTPSKYEVTEQTISFSSLLNFIQNDNPMVQQHALALYNALFRLGDKHKKRKMKQIMEERQTRRIIVEYIIRKNPNEEMRHQLYVLQTLLLNLLEERMYTMVESQGPKALEKIKELRKIAFESRSDSAPVQKRFAEEYKRLGFTNDVDPTQDFKEAPPGMLALDMMYAFACNHSDQYTKLVLESSCRGDQHDCPFARSSIEIVKLICQIIRIGHEPLSSGSRGGRFYPMFFTHENPLEVFEKNICMVSERCLFTYANSSDLGLSH